MKISDRVFKRTEDGLGTGVVVKLKGNRKRSQRMRWQHLLVGAVKSINPLGARLEQRVGLGVF